MNKNEEYAAPGDTRCDFARETNSGLVWRCDRHDTEEIEMHDGGKVRLCKGHRNWSPALAHSDPNDATAPHNEAVQP